MTQGIEEGLLRSRELPDSLDAFGDQIRDYMELFVEAIRPQCGRLHLLVKAIRPHDGRFHLLIEAILPYIDAILSYVGAILSCRDCFQNRFDAFEALPDLRFHGAKYISGSGDH